MNTTIDKQKRSTRRLLAPLGALVLLVASAGAQAEMNVQLPSARAHGNSGAVDRGSVFTNARSASDRRHDGRRGHERREYYDRKRHHDKRRHHNKRRAELNRYGHHDNRRYQGRRGGDYGRRHYDSRRYGHQRRYRLDQYQRRNDRWRHREARRDDDRKNDWSSWFGLR